MTFLEVIVATSVGAASMWAAASFFSFNVRQTRSLTTQKIGKRFEEQVRLAVATRFQAYLDRVVLPAAGSGETCDAADTDNNFTVFMNGTGLGQTPIVLDSEITLQVLDLDTMAAFVNSSGDATRFDGEILKSAPYATSLDRCRRAQLALGVPLVPYLYTMSGGPTTSARSEFLVGTDFHFCLWMKPVNGTGSQLTRDTGMMGPAIFEARYTVKNATTGETISCQDMESGTNTEIYNTPLLFDQVANTLGCSIDGTGAFVCADPGVCNCVDPGVCPTWNDCVRAYKANSVWRAELVARVKKARVGNLNYSLHWIANGLGDSAGYGKALGAYVYTAGN